MQQRTWRLAAAVVLTSLAVPMAVNAQTPKSGGIQIMMGPATIEQDTAKKDSTKADSTKPVAKAQGQVIMLQMAPAKPGQQGQVITLPSNAINFSFGPATPAPKDTAKAAAGDCKAQGAMVMGNDSAQKGGMGVMNMGDSSCDKKGDSTATPKP